MPFQAIEPRRLYRQIADQLRALIEAGEFRVGTRLPPERDLALKMGVSRPSVREALIALEVEGLVEVRMGSGIYVRAGGRWPGWRQRGGGKSAGHHPGAATDRRRARGAGRAGDEGRGHRWLA